MEVQTSRDYWKSTVDLRIASRLKEWAVRNKSGHKTVFGSRDGRWKVWDEEIDGLLEVILSARAARNAATPGILRLPPEILSLIFAYLAAVDPPTRIGKKITMQLTEVAVGYRLGWMGVTHVCKRWRQVAVDDPSLWTNLDSFNLSRHWFDFIVKRTSEAGTLLSVSVDWYQYRRKVPPAIKIALHNLRLRNLTLYHEPGDPHAGRKSKIVNILFNGRRRGPAPFLESLTMQSKRAFNLILPSDFLATETPRLKSLTLNHCAIQWDSPLLRNLVHLDLSVTRDFDRTVPSSHRPSIRQLRAVLAACPKLEHLSLSGVIDTLTPEDADTTVTALPHLTFILVRGSIVKCGYLMRHVSIPSTARRTVIQDILDDEHPMDELPSLYDLGAVSLPARSLSIRSAFAGDRVYLSYWTEPQKWLTSPSPYIDPMEEEDEWEDEGAHYMLCVHQLARTIPDVVNLYPLDFSQVQDLMVQSGAWDDRVGWSREQWSTLLSSAVNITRMVLIGITTGECLSMLTPLGSTDTAGTSSVPLPALRSLAIRYVRFHEGGPAPEWTEESVTVGILIGCLQARRARGAVLDIIELPQLYKDAPWLDQVKECVPRVEHGVDILPVFI
ncbi:hypothetical protein FA95DRAFT_682686 [Auriscalpium vulgare]|uniref:Uncharacterized protein n=1 Tax=Auriscalpium vulgare TaxID=40419 RepID=A0ACB8S1W7_9AGAM|nr:hypothetical protein FA95DRAFT_682686 [Auriscalpium vulgare]